MTVLRIEEKRNRVTLCGEKDVVGEDGMLIFRRGIFTSWAKISVKKQSRFTRDGLAMDDNSTTKVSHQIFMNYRPDVDISLAAWIYDARLKSAPRWFKVQSVSDSDGIWTFDCRLIESAEDAVDPVESVPDTLAPTHGLPDGVTL